MKNPKFSTHERIPEMISLTEKFKFFDNKKTHPRWNRPDFIMITLFLEMFFFGFLVFSMLIKDINDGSDDSITNIVMLIMVIVWAFAIGILVPPIIESTGLTQEKYLLVMSLFHNYHHHTKGLSIAYSYLCT